jgi:hypothetical protein
MAILHLEPRQVLEFVTSVHKRLLVHRGNKLVLQDVALVSPDIGINYKFLLKIHILQICREDLP